jgi:voltage-gated potassium channel
VPSDRADIRLPSSERGPLEVLLRRLALASGLVLIVSVITYIDRDGFKDGGGGEIGLLDALYFGAVSVTSTGYGDITPVTDEARLVNTFIVMPAGVLFLVILVSTTLEVLAERTRTVYREKLWRKTLRDHIIVCGFGVKGRAAVATMLAHGKAAGDIVVIDERAEAVEEARRRGHAGIVANASAASALEAGGVREAAAVVVAPDRDDSAVLITLTARELTAAPGSLRPCARPRTRTCSSRAAPTPSSSRPAPPGGCSATPCAARASCRCSRTSCPSARGST